MKLTLPLLLLIFCNQSGRGQDYDLPFGHIVLDSFTVTAVQDGLDIADLIHIMQFDSTLYIAFNNLHFTAYSYESEATAYDRRGEVEAHQVRKVKQDWDGNCREQTLDLLEEQGDFTNRRGRDRYYTLELFDRTFYEERRICGEQRKTNWHALLYEDKKEGHVAAIKQVVFNPGTGVDLPLIGDKFALFDEAMMPYYDYAINGVTIDGAPAYEFTIRVKPEFVDTRKAVIVRELVTTFRSADFQILSRKYHLDYDGALVKLNLNMDIRLTSSNEVFYPKHFKYSGFWNVPLKKLEAVSLYTDFSYSDE